MIERLKRIATLGAVGAACAALGGCLITNFSATQSGGLTRATATVTLHNHSNADAPMLMLDLPVPAGFELDASELEELVRGERIAKFQQTPRQLVIYLRGLPARNRLSGGRNPFTHSTNRPRRRAPNGGWSKDCS